MAGTGLPIPQSGVLAQGPGVMDGDRLTSASAWASIGRVGEQIADIGASMVQTQRAAYFAEQEMGAERKRAELLSRFPNDPDGFQSAWNGFVSGKLQEVDGSVLQPLQRIYDAKGTAGYSQLVQHKAARDYALAGDNLAARLQAQSDDVMGLASAGDAGSPNFVASMTTWDGIAAERVRSGMIAPERVALDRERLLARATGEAVLFKSQQIYEEKGLSAALEDASKAMEVANVPPAIRRQYLNQVEGALRTREVQRKVDVKEAMEAASPVMRMLEDGVEGLQDEGEAIVERLREMRAPLEAAKVQRALMKNEGILRGRTNLPTRQWDPAGFLGKMRRVESGGDATAANPNSSAFGADQFTAGTWLGVVRQHRPDLIAGKSEAEVLALRGDEALSAEMAGYHAQDNAGVLRAANIPVTDGTQYLAWFAGAGGATALWRADPQASAESVLGAAAVKANPFLRDMNAADVIAWADKKMEDAAVAGMDPAMLEGYRQGQRQLFDQVFPDMKKDAEFWGLTPDSAGMLVDMAQWLDEPRLAKMREAFTTGNLVQTLRGLRPDQRAAFFSGLEDRAAGGDAGARSLLRDLDRVRASLNELEANDPMRRGIQAKWTQGPELLDWGADAATLNSGIRARGRDAEIVGQQAQRADVPALTLGEADSLANALRTGDGAKVSGLLGALESLPPAVYSATLGMPAVSAAVEALTRSSDVGKVTASFSALGALEARDPIGFRRQFPGGDTEKRLALWQTWLSYKDPQELTEIVKAQSDPVKRKAQDDQRKAADAISDKFTDGQFMSMLDPSYWPFDEPSAPTRPEAFARMKVEAKTLFADAYAQTGDESAAVKMASKMLRTVWGDSRFGGGGAMRRPPENYYPTIGGSRDWMDSQWDQFVASRPAGEGTGYQLVAAVETERDASAGKPPRYEVVYRRTDGAWDIVRGENSQRVVFAFDEKRAEAEQWDQQPGIFARLKQNLRADSHGGGGKVNIFTGEPF